MVEIIAAEQLREQMNRAASKGEPFLFGIDFELENGFFVERPLEQNDLLWRTPKKSNFVRQPTLNQGTYFRSTPLSFEEYERRFVIIIEGLLRGDSFLTNLTIKTPLQMDYSLREIALRCNSPYVLMIPDRLICFSPEIFIRVENGQNISSNPMKGTLDASIPNAERLLMDDSKERAEHYTVVDLIRNDLSIVATEVTVEKFRYLDKLHTSRGPILQTSTLISGQLTDLSSQRLGDTLFAMLPAGSVSGAPKAATLSLIRQAEGEKREFYCGVFGYFDGCNLDSAVMIRFIEQDIDGQFYFRSGSGITAKSNVRFEYEEVIQKIYLPF